jgi:hypothetical protein
VEDTEGEEDEEELLLTSDIENDEDNNRGQRQYSYNTFGPPTPIPNGDVLEEERPPFGPIRKKSTVISMKTNPSRWSLAETAEIWGELEDRDAAESPLLPSMHRRRSNTLPRLQHSGSPTTAFPPLLSGRRVTGPPGTLAVPGAAEASTDATLGARRAAFRRRRKSTGFPGFTARKTAKRTSSVGGGALPDALGGLWRFRWWQNMKRKGKAVDPEHGQGRQHWSVGPYRDEDAVVEDVDAPPTRPLLPEGSHQLPASGSGGSKGGRKPDREEDTPG